MYFNDRSSQKIEGSLCLGKDKKNYFLMLLPIEEEE